MNVYDLAINTPFQPYSYQELLAPAMDSTKEHQAIEENLAMLDEKSSVWDGMTDPIADKESHGKYLSFANKLKEQASQLSRNGLNPQSRQGFNSIRSQYSKDIVPIENAFNKRSEYTKAVSTTLMSNPYMIVDENTDPRNRSLDDYVKNPNLQPRMINGAEITKRVATTAQQIAQSIANDPQISIKMGGEKWAVKLQSGLTMEDIDKVMTSNDSISTALRNAVLSSVTGTGVEGWGSTKATKEAMDAAKAGLYTALGKTNTEYMDRKQWVVDAEVAKAKADKAGPVTNPIGSLNTVRVDNKIKSLNKELDYLKDYDVSKNARSLYSSVSANTFGVYSGKDAIMIKEGKDKMISLASRYGIKPDKNGDYSTAEVKKAIDNDIFKSARLEKSFPLFYQDATIVKTGLLPKLSLRAANGGVIPVYDSNTNERISKREFKNMIESEAGIVSFVPSTGITYTLSDGTEYIIDGESIGAYDDKEIRVRKQAIDNIRNNPKATEADLILAASYSTDIAHLLDFSMNSLLQKQSPTRPANQ